MELSQKLKELRKKQGLTQLELAERLFVSRQAISGWEAGTSRPSTENLQSLSRLFNIPLETLLDDSRRGGACGGARETSGRGAGKRRGGDKGTGKGQKIQGHSPGDCALGDFAHHSGIGTGERPKKNGCHDF